MNPLLLSWIAIAAGILGLVFGITYYATGQQKVVLRVSAAILIIVCVASNFLSRM